MVCWSNYSNVPQLPDYSDEEPSLDDFICDLCNNSWCDGGCDDNSYTDDDTIFCASCEEIICDCGNSYCIGCGKSSRYCAGCCHCGATENLEDHCFLCCSDTCDNDCDICIACGENGCQMRCPEADEPCKHCESYYCYGVYICNARNLEGYTISSDSDDDIITEEDLSFE